MSKKSPLFTTLEQRFACTQNHRVEIFRISKDKQSVFVLRSAPFTLPVHSYTESKLHTDQNGFGKLLPLSYQEKVNFVCDLLNRRNRVKHVLTHEELTAETWSIILSTIGSNPSALCLALQHFHFPDRHGKRKSYSGP